MLKERFYPYSLRVQQHKNHSLNLVQNEKNIEKCLMMNTCLLMSNFTLSHEKLLEIFLIHTFFG
jgi:hypothetical protein